MFAFYFRARAPVQEQALAVIANANEIGVRAALAVIVVLAVLEFRVLELDRAAAAVQHCAGKRIIESNRGVLETA